MVRKYRVDEMMRKYRVDEMMRKYRVDEMMRKHLFCSAVAASTTVQHQQHISGSGWNRLWVKQ